MAPGRAVARPLVVQEMISQEISQEKMEESRSEALPVDEVPEVISPSTPDIKTDWAKVLMPKPSKAIFYGVQLQGPEPFALNATTSMAPASVSKVLTSVVALKKLGPDFRFKTTLQFVRSEQDPSIATQINVIGDGDPTWGMEVYSEAESSRVSWLAEQLYVAGIRTIDGPITFTAADERWNKPVYPQGWKVTDHTVCYGALPQAFNFSANCAVYTVKSQTRGQWESSDIPVPVVFALKKGKYTRIAVQPLENGTRYRVLGTWASGSRPRSFALPIHDTQGWLRSLFVRILKMRGIDIKTRSLAAAHAESSGAVEEIVFESRQLKDILMPLMKDSINIIGESIFRKIGQLTPSSENSDLLNSAQKLMTAFLQEAGVRSTRILDGSGLSRESQITTQGLLEVLEQTKKETFFNDFVETLPIAGVDGTLKARMKNSAATGLVLAKTGTLSGIYNLAGYVAKKSAAGVVSDYFPFVVFSKTTVTKRYEVKAAQDRVAIKLSTLVNPK